MKPPPRPLMFLAAVVGLWTVGRIVALAPDWNPNEALEPPRLAERPAATIKPPVSAAPPQPFPNLAARAPLGMPSDWSPLPSGQIGGYNSGSTRRLPGTRSVMLSAASASEVVPLAAAPPAHPLRSSTAASLVQASPLLPPLLAARSGPGRLGGSAWLLVRGDVRGVGLAPGGTLGGSQAGLRMTYRLNGNRDRPLALSARVYAPLARPSGSEAALGLDWRPVAEVPVHILAERREAIGREGRSDFALTLYGGVDRPVAGGRLHLQAYGQAGVVGMGERELFADGAARLTTRAGPLHVGGGVWGGAQPGVERLDVGPHASIRVPVGRAAVTVAAEWRFRIAGDAAPASGPALTVATDF